MSFHGMLTGYQVYYKIVRKRIALQSCLVFHLTLGTWEALRYYGRSALEKRQYMKMWEHVGFSAIFTVLLFLGDVDR